MEKKIKILPLSKWQLPSTRRPLAIAGPCSAETENQMLATAQGLAEAGINVFRAGIWKPRTRPGSFEGVGAVGLEWMKKVKQQFGMITCTEVANVKHVYQALKAGIDMLWIGARTTANPFAVQDLANALQGVDIPVLIKNPVNPDVELWIGAIERFYHAGITKIAVIHRGFSSFEKTAFRNAPQWQLPIELKRRIKKIPLICDPSHICGNRERLLEISQKAMDLDYNGLMIESHIAPDTALSDAQQQITPDTLARLLSKLVLRTTKIEDPDFLNSLEELRNEIDLLDDELIEILGRRMKIVHQIGEYKKRNKITVLQAKRWDQILKKSFERGKKQKLSNDFIGKLFREIHQESINHQTQLINS